MRFLGSSSVAVSDRTDESEGLRRAMSERIWKMGIVCKRKLVLWSASEHLSGQDLDGRTLPMNVFRPPSKTAL